MIIVKCTYTNGDIITTRFNGTLQEAEAYFLNQVFNVGTVYDNIQKCIKVEQIRVSGYSLNEGSRTFQILSRKELGKIIDELDPSEIWERTYEKGEGHRYHSGTAYTYIDARTGEIHTSWLQQNQSLHPWDSFYEIWLCSMETGAGWWDFNNAEDLLDTTSEEYEEFWDFRGSAEEYIITKYGENELAERIQNCIDWYANEFEFDWESIENQLDELYSYPHTDE